jgi:hypothetical protein
MPSGFSRAGLHLPFFRSARSHGHMSTFGAAHTVICPLLAWPTHNTCTQRMQWVILVGFRCLVTTSSAGARRKTSGAKHPAQSDHATYHLGRPSPAFVSHKRRVAPFDVLQLHLLPLTFSPLSLSSAPFSTILLTMVARNTLLALVAASAGALVSAQGSGDGVQFSSLFFPCVADGAPQGRTTTPDSARAGSQTRTAT